uniref:C2H2-type domain-containing protein n=1 Tax=Globodera rostochiensis TaxID=31243 RepID=A0A914HP30_GLORO
MSPQYDTHKPSNAHIGVMSGFCNSYIEASNKRVQAGFGIIEEKFTGQFQCTFQSCNKRLKNNVMFMYHIWAHVAQQKPTKNEEQCSNLQNLLAEHNGAEDEAKTDAQRTDVSRLHTCPECLLEQPTPYRARLHYHLPFFRI